ncbi:MAG: hypothetical protein IJT80_02840 [Lachnospiraceae bacterium]|nr:hypothetical protein [Lachnospiraceae bacterium]
MTENKGTVLYNGKMLLNAAGIIVLVYTAVFLFGMTRSSLAEISVPNEFQEVANIQLTQAFLQGINPYSKAGAFGGEVPGVLYAYGPVYSLITACVALILPADLILLHYAVSFCAMLGAAFLGAWMVKEHTETLAAPAVTFVLLINCTWRYGYINAVPDALAFFWVMLVIFIETRKKCRGRELLEIILIILALHTKIYMAYIALPLFIYKLLADRKAAVRFFVYGIVLMTVFSVAVTVWCPLSWAYYIYFLHGPFAGPQPSGTGSSGLKELKDLITLRNSSDPESGLGYEILQLRSIVGIFLFFFVTAVIAVCVLIKQKFKDCDPFVRLLMVCFLVSVPVMFVLGTNDGAWLSYYLQIQIPPLVMLSLIFAEKKCLEENKPWMSVFWKAFLCVMILFTLFRTSKRLPYYYMLPEQKEIWEEAYGLIDEYAEHGEIYYSPILAFDAVRNDRYYYNNGYVGAASRALYSEYLDTAWQQKLFPYAGEVMKKHFEYRESLEDKIRNGGFSLIAVNEGTDGTDRAIRISSITDGPYVLLKELDMPVSRVNFPVKLYVLKEGE